MPMPKPLSAADQAAVHDLADAANSADGVRPLSERTLLDLDLLHEIVGHLLVWQGGELAAYAQLGRERQGELVVHPAHRRAGHGRNLLTHLAGQGAAAVWAHGDLPAAAFQAAHIVLIGQLRHVIVGGGAHFGGQTLLPSGVQTSSESLYS